MAPFEQLQARATEVASVLKLLANPKRLLILCHLQDGPCTVTDLQEKVGLSQSALSQHLAKMRADGLVSVIKKGTYAHYQIADASVKKIIALLYVLYCKS